MSESANPQVILAWKAPLRPYKKRGKRILRFFLALAFLLSIIVVFFSDIIILIPIWAVLFLFYTLTITPPQDIEHKITKFGIESGDITVRWELLSHFYFLERFGFTLLTMVAHPPFHTHLYFIVPTQELKEKLIHILSEHLIYQDKHKKTFTEKMIDWLSHLVPDDDEDEKKHKSGGSGEKI